LTVPEPLPPDAPSPRGLASAPQGSAWWWVALLVVAAFSYLYGLDGQYVPRIGDEMPYAQVTRVTAASGQWLPLKADDPFLENTKPPLLFWLGIVSTDWGKSWTLWRLRFPIVVVTFVTALVVFLLGRRLAGTVTGLIAAVVFLGFFGTFRYGRPFLTNLPETLFVFAPFAFAVARPERLDRWAFWAGAAVSLGLACWVKSFVLVAPVGFAFAWWTLSRRGWRWGEWFRRDAPKLAVFGVAALGLFFVWPLVDPNGRAVLEQFVGRENLGKIGSEGNYFVEMFAGRHSVWRNWFGHFSNVGLYAFVLLALSIDAWRRRTALSEPEKALWILVLGFLVVYTFPTHRQENYLLPTTPALAVLMALRWSSFGGWTLRASSVATLLAGVAACWFAALVSRYQAGPEAGMGFDYSVFDIALLASVPMISLIALIRMRWAVVLFPLAVTFAHISLACATHPFEEQQWPAEVEQRGVVYVPSNFRVKEEAYRFAWPHSTPVGYPLRSSPWIDPRTGKPHGDAAVVVRTTKEMDVFPQHPTRKQFELAGRYTLASRLDDDDLGMLLLEGKIEGILRMEILARPAESPR
jgi:4-amino-4-deoxy-L-arabinose transferase-like glycosyltransferase